MTGFAEIATPRPLDELDFGTARAWRQAAQEAARQRLGYEMLRGTSSLWIGAAIAQLAHHGAAQGWVGADWDRIAPDLLATSGREAEASLRIYADCGLLNVAREPCGNRWFTCFRLSPAMAVRAWHHDLLPQDLETPFGPVDALEGEPS